MGDPRERGVDVPFTFHNQDQEPSGARGGPITSSEQLTIFQGTPTYKSKYGKNGETGDIR